MHGVSARPWQLPLRSGLFSLANSFGASAVVAELHVGGGDIRTAVAGVLVPLAGMVLGVVLLVRALPKLARDGRLRLFSAKVRDALPEEFALITGYVPRDAADGAIDMIIVGPTGVFAVEMCESAGTLACYEDIWYRKHTTSAWRVDASPSVAARRNAERLRSDVRTGGFVRATVEPLVVLVYGHTVELTGCSAAVAEGVEGLVRQVRLWNRAPLSDQRARAIARTLSGTLGIAS